MPYRCIAKRKQNKIKTRYELKISKKSSSQRVRFFLLFFWFGRSQCFDFRRFYAIFYVLSEVAEFVMGGSRGTITHLFDVEDERCGDYGIC